MSREKHPWTHGVLGTERTRVAYLSHTPFVSSDSFCKFLHIHIMCVWVSVCDLSRKALVNFCCEDRGPQVMSSLRAPLGHGSNSSHRRTRRGGERENKLKSEGGKQGTQSEKKRPLRNASGRHQRQSRSYKRSWGQ